MPSASATQIESQLRQITLPDLLPDPAQREFVFPAYGARSLANVASTLGVLLRVPLAGVSPALDASYWEGCAPGVRRVVMVLLDALGYLQLQAMLAQEPDSVWGRLARRGCLLPMTSVCPSTTDTAMATLLTGKEPIAHGLLGYELWLREYGVLAEMLAVKPAFGNGGHTLLDWGLAPESFLPVPGLGALLAQGGVATTAVVPAQFTRGALTRMCYRGFQTMFGYTNVEAMWAIARHALARDRAERSLFFLYWGGIDSAIHAHGSAGTFWRDQYHAATQACDEQFLSQLTPQQCEGTLFIMLADHGFVDAPEQLAHNTETDAVLKRHLIIPYSGEARTSYLHCFGGDGPSVQSALAQTLGPNFVLRRTRDAIASGLFGTSAPAAESAARLGHFLVIARGQHYLDRKNLRQKLRGRHGGLSPEEMLVPWLAARLDR